MKTALVSIALLLGCGGSYFFGWLHGYDDGSRGLDEVQDKLERVQRELHSIKSSVGNSHGAASFS